MRSRRAPRPRIRPLPLARRPASTRSPLTMRRSSAPATHGRATARSSPRAATWVRGRGPPRSPRAPEPRADPRALRPSTPPPSSPPHQRSSPPRRDRRHEHVLLHEGGPRRRAPLRPRDAAVDDAPRREAVRVPVVPHAGARRARRSRARQYAWLGARAARALLPRSQLLARLRSSSRGLHAGSRAARALRARNTSTSKKTNARAPPRPAAAARARRWRSPTTA